MSHLLLLFIILFNGPVYGQDTQIEVRPHSFRAMVERNMQPVLRAMLARGHTNYIYNTLVPLDLNSAVNIARGNIMISVHYGTHGLGNIRNLREATMIELKIMGALFEAMILAINAPNVGEVGEVTQRWERPTRNQLIEAGVYGIARQSAYERLGHEIAIVNEFNDEDWASAKDLVCMFYIKGYLSSYFRASCTL